MTVYECFSCGCTFKDVDGEYNRYGHIACPSCGDTNLKIVFEDVYTEPTEDMIDKAEYSGVLDEDISCNLS